MTDGACLYFHSPCFDGIVSAVLALDFLEMTQDWKFTDLQPVNYDRRATWLSEDLNQPFAVVDFLHHPDAQFWADHHQTSFLTLALKKEFELRNNPYHIYNSKVGSCAKLLWQALQSRFHYRKKDFAEMVKWADKIDSARYGSVAEAISGSHSALNINRALVVNRDPEYPVWLVRQLRKHSLDEIGQSPAIIRQSNEAHTLTQAGLERFSQTVHLDGRDIVVFDVDSSDVLINRYAPYHFYPQARYSLGVVRTNDGIKITAMRNPWREFPSVYLGKIFERFGGGGHRRVGSLVLKGSKAENPSPVLNQLLRAIRKSEANKKSVAA